MTAKKFMFFKLIIAMILAGVVSSFVVVGNYLVPLAAIFTAVVLVLFMRRRVSQVMADERDYQIAGKAARYAMTIFTAVVGLVILVLFAWRPGNPAFELVGSALAYAICGLMLLYSIIFKYYSREK